jgi:predicted outer membrane protein
VRRKPSRVLKAVLAAACGALPGLVVSAAKTDFPFTVRSRVMMRKTWIRHAAILAICGLSVGAVRWTFAQATVQPGSAEQAAQERALPATDRAAQDQQPATARRAGEAAGQIDNRELAIMLLIGNQKEIALGRFGATRSQNPEVKQFAQQMVQDHGQFLGRLAQAAGARELAPGAADASATENREPAARADATARIPGQAAGADQARATAERGQWQRFDLGHSPYVNLQRELAEQCLQSAEQFLAQQQGPEFDRWFMAVQLLGHMGMRDTLKVAQKHATGEFRQTIDQGLQTTEQHLQQAEQVLRQLAQAAPAQRTGARPTPSSKQ